MLLLSNENVYIPESKISKKYCSMTSANIKTELKQTIDLSN